MLLRWYSSANILYALGSLGYLANNIVNLIDRTTVESFATYLVLIILAILFVIDALLYTADWFEQRATKKRRELIGCLLNLTGSILYLIGTTVFKNKKISTNDLFNLTDIPPFIFNIVGMLAYLGESILSFFMPRVSQQPSKCSVEFFAHLLNLLGNITYLSAHIIQPILVLIAHLITDFFRRITDTIFIIIRPIQIAGDIIYAIDALLYMIVSIKANEQMRKVGVAWIERGNTTINRCTTRQKSNMTTSKQLPQPVFVDRAPSIVNPLVVETIT